MYFCKHGVEMIHVLQRAVGKYMVEASIGFGHLVCRGDMDFAVNTTLPTQFRHAGTHVYTDYIRGLRPEQSKISTIATAKIQDATIKPMVPICCVLPCAPVTKRGNVWVEFADPIVRLQNLFCSKNAHYDGALFTIMQLGPLFDRMRLDLM